MLHLLCTSELVEWFSLAASSFLSVAVIVVTIVTSLFNYKIQKQLALITKDSASWPFKIEIVDSLIEFDKQYYEVCTRLLITESITQNDVDESFRNLDKMLTSLYADLRKLQTFYDSNSRIIMNINNLYSETAELYSSFIRCRFLLVDDIKIGINNINTTVTLKSCTKYVQEIIHNTDRFTLYTQRMNQESIDFIKQYAKVFDLLEKYNLTDILSSSAK